MSVIERIEGMSVDEFMRLYDQEGPFELLNGKRVPMSPTGYAHTAVSRTLFRALDAYCTAHKLGEVFFEGTFVLSDRPNWVTGSRQPDVMFIDAARFAKWLTERGPNLMRPPVLVPTLAVEIVSPTDRAKEVLKKVLLYITDGVQMVWVINPQSLSVTIYREDTTDPLVIDRNGTLNGTEVIPGFTLPVAALFEWEIS